ncbi:unnamed protein product, partial [Nesidiocoris tenuis]
MRSRMSMFLEIYLPTVAISHHLLNPSTLQPGTRGKNECLHLQMKNNPRPMIRHKKDKIEENLGEGKDGGANVIILSDNLRNCFFGYRWRRYRGDKGYRRQKQVTVDWGETFVGHSM